MQHPAPHASTNADESAIANTSGLGRVLIAAYLILALAATLRAVYQIITKFDEAPFAYSLSLVSGLVYIVATVALLKRTGVWRIVGWCALSFEFAGVLIVGALSFTHRELFGHDSVWSYFGSGYLFIPLVLPLLGMRWLRQDRLEQARARADETRQVDATESLY